METVSTIWSRILDFSLWICYGLRWKLARFMDRYSDTCWADLATWATYAEDYPFSDILHMRNRAGQCERRGDYPYCGKCELMYQPAGEE